MVESHLYNFPVVLHLKEEASKEAVALKSIFLPEDIIQEPYQIRLKIEVLLLKGVCGAPPSSPCVLPHQ